MKHTVENMIEYFTKNFSEKFFIDYEEDEKKKVVFIQFLLDKVTDINSVINLFSKINESKFLCKKQEFELWKTKENEPIIQINYIL